MNNQWIKLSIKFLLWLGCELLFNLTGVDTIADYNEFLLQQHTSSIFNYKLVIFLEN